MKKLKLILCGVFLNFILAGSAMATEVYNAGTYAMPDGNGDIASLTLPGGLDHYSYYLWTISDFSPAPMVGSTLNIVFHGIYDWMPEEDLLSVYIQADTTASIGISEAQDNQSLTDPDWTGYTLLGSWSYPDSGSYDVVFSLVIDSDWSTYLSNGGTFTIGIDPDCHYYMDKITVNAPVPEPATMLLLGAGLVGLGAFRRKRLVKNV